MTTNDRRDVPLDDDRTLDNDDLEADPDLGGNRGLDDDRTTDEPNGRTTDLDERTNRTDDLDGSTTTDEPNGRTSAADEPLVAEDSAVDYRARWEVVQQGFVDDPRNAVSEADKLVDDVLKHLADGFDRQHQDLEQQWSNGEPSTEDLRSALQRYRAFFQRLLTL
ncbi:hypothetical protein EV649_8123 [Kribbella sp. VKM Ac-2569]|uniref:hypothetical protein n=1 Tax=Kribbella sp. VKM Ac-2569 TaxID=2512220 RepID=UPI00102B7A80|nr:hypothetical protein [Kribbella sp. VKM Ac-2569]RZT07416.1 hypothetical protein EV649_8123 [Kribbella sp. VKM Ac-2569]